MRAQQDDAAAGINGCAAGHDRRNVHSVAAADNRLIFRQAFGVSEAPATSRRKTSGFTLIELLMVIAIMSLLVSLLLPSLAFVTRLAKESVCVQHLHGIGNAIHIYQAELDEIDPWLFSNGSGDHPHEGRNMGRQRGNPAKVLVPSFLVQPKMLFCPLAPVTFEQHYEQTPQRGNNTFWGSYCWRFRNIPRNEDPYWPKHHASDIQYANRVAEEVVMTDVQAFYWTNYGFKEPWFHFNVLMLDNSTRLITRDGPTSRKWLWGPGGKPYDSYRD